MRLGHSKIKSNFSVTPRSIKLLFQFTLWHFVNFKITLSFQVKDAISLCEFFAWLEKEVSVKKNNNIHFLFILVN